MSCDRVSRAWEECVIVPEKGNRIVHYVLRDSTGNSLLAVIGRERSVYHMSYTISQDYLRVFGSTSTVRAGTKWQSRREVVQFLISVVSKGGPIFANSSERIEVSASRGPVNQVSKRTKRSRSLLANFSSDNQVAKREPPCKRSAVIDVPTPEQECRVFSNTNGGSGMQGLNLKKQFILRYNEEMSRGRYS